MVSQINFSVDEKIVSVAPGASVELGVTVQNLTILLDQVAVRLEGIDPAWVQVIPPQLPVFAQSQATARVIVQPPFDLATSLAGDYPLRVTGASQENPDQVGETTAALEIQLSGDYEAQLEPGTMAATGAGTFALRVKNRANTPLEATFRASDDEDALWYKFEPFRLEVSPGSETTTRLQVRAKQMRANQRKVEFTMVINGEYILKGGTRIEATPQTLSAAYQVPAPEALRLHIQPISNGKDQKKSYEVRVGNPSPAPITVRLAGQASESFLDFEFTPQELIISPRSEATAMLAVHPLSAISDGRTETFRVLALPEDDALEPVSAEGTYTAQRLAPTAPISPEPLSVQQPIPKTSVLPWAALLSGLLSFVVTFLVVLVVALVSGWSP